MTGPADANPVWRGWCPNHPAAQAARPKIGSGVILVAVACLLLIPAAALMIPAHTPKDVAVWAFRIDDTGARDFSARLIATEDVSDRIILPANTGGTPALPAGRYWLVIEQPGGDGTYRYTLDGAVVEGRPMDSPNGNMKFFTVTGPGSLSGEYAYEALMAAYNGGTYVTGSTIVPAIRGVSEREVTIG